jgi:hypothetical protein
MTEDELEKMAAESTAHLERDRVKHTFRLGEALRLPANPREEAAVARGMEIDQRRYQVRMLSYDDPDARFRFTPAERQLKRRLLKAGLIVDKPQPLRYNRRSRIKAVDDRFERTAEIFASSGDPDAIEMLGRIKHNKKQAVWMKRQRMLRRLEPRELLDAARDVTEKRGIQRSLAATWHDFVKSWGAAKPERQAAFMSNENLPDGLANLLRTLAP